MLSLAGTRPERWTRCQRARAHAKSGAEWRRHVAQHVATAGTTAVIADGAGGIRAQPVATEVALRVDALDGETGQILHFFLPPAAVRGDDNHRQTPDRPKKQKRWRELSREPPVVSRENTAIYSGGFAIVENPVENARSCLEVATRPAAKTWTQSIVTRWLLDPVQKVVSG
jgi:hypothetical protein